MKYLIMLFLSKNTIPRRQKKLMAVRGSILS